MNTFLQRNAEIAKRLIVTLDKAIKSGKEWREPYRKSKAFDGSCRNHKGCPACLSNRTHKVRKAMDKVVDMEVYI